MACGWSGPSGGGRARGDAPVAGERPKKRGEQAAREKRERRAGLRERAGPGILLGWVLCFFPIFFLLFYSNSNHSN